MSKEDQSEIQAEIWQKLTEIKKECEQLKAFADFGRTVFDFVVAHTKATAAELSIDLTSTNHLPQLIKVAQDATKMQKAILETLNGHDLGYILHGQGCDAGTDANKPCMCYIRSLRESLPGYPNHPEWT